MTQISCERYAGCHFVGGGSVAGRSTRLPAVVKSKGPTMPMKPEAHNAKQQAERRRERDALRGNEIYGSRWRKLSKERLRRFPLCEMCKAEGKIVQAECTDHIQPLWVDRSRVHDESNLQSLCLSHNGKKSITDRKLYQPRQR